MSAGQTRSVASARIRLQRKVVGISQGALADALGITFQQVQKYERGTNRISASMLVRSARRLDCSVGALVGEEGGLPEDALALIAMSPPLMELMEAFAVVRSGRMQRALVRFVKDLVGRGDEDPGAVGD